MSLNKACRCLLLADDKLHGLVIQAVAAKQIARAADRHAVLLLGNDLFIVIRLALLAQEIGDGLNLVIRDERAVHPRHPATTLHEEHVAAPKKLFGPLLAKNGAAVDPRGDLETDPCREIRLDGAGDDIDRRALRRHDDMNAGGARHLC